MPKHITTKSSPSTLVRKIRSPNTTGVAPAAPGNSSRHRRFSVVLQEVGTFRSSLIPWFNGPRHDGQLLRDTLLWDTTDASSTRAKVSDNTDCFIIC
jgi:hypothetical protein